jgi:RNA polymerase sigma-70 factor (ECF subfamily)
VSQRRDDARRRRQNETALSALSDQELATHFLAGEEQAFAELHRRYEREVYGMACYLLRNHADAEDVTQEVFRKAARGLYAFRGVSSFKTWLMQIVRTTALNTPRRAKPRRRAERAYAGERPTEEGRQPLDTVLAGEKERLDREWRWLAARILRRHVVLLDRLVLRLRFDEDLTYPEIAEIFGMRDESGRLDDERPRTIVDRQLRILRRHLSPPGHC